MSNNSIPTFYDDFQAREIHLTQFFGGWEVTPPPPEFLYPTKDFRGQLCPTPTPQLLNLILYTNNSLKFWTHILSLNTLAL